jgi:N-acetylglucosamine kinase-like BadF-type ATPase
MVEYIVGIDQGGTKTRICISDYEGRIIGSEVTDGCWQNIGGIDNALNYILEGYDYLMEKHQIKEEDVSIIVAGVAGIDFKFEEELFYLQMRKHFKNKSIYLVNDAIIALKSGLIQSDGAIVCAGTGSNCVVINKEGKSKISGYYIGDDLQGANGIGKRAIKAVFDSESGVAETTLLTEKILNHFEIDNVDTLLEEYVNKIHIKEDLKNLTVYVFDCAEQGDEVAKRILLTFGNELAKFVVAGAKKLEITDVPFELVITGGVFTKEDNLITNELTQEVKKNIPKMKLVEPIYEPVLGAIFLGLEKLDIQMDEKILQNILLTSKRNDLIRKRC